MSDGRVPPGILLRLEQAEQLKLAGQHREALAVLEGVLQEDPGNVTVLEEIADNELSLRAFTRAEIAAQHAVHLDAKSYIGHYILGFIRSHESKWDEAVVELKIANKLKANNPEILRCLGWALFHQGGQAEGVVTLERALNIDSDSTMTLCDLGVAYLELRHPNKAKALFERVLELEPQNDRAKECVALVTRLERSE
jgi:Tfp pilus assembly protein PilF